MTLPASASSDTDVPETTPYDGTLPGQWVQVGLAMTDKGTRPLCPELAATLHDWTDSGLLSDFFFMHKPPGMRLRLAPSPGHIPQVRAALRNRIREWLDAGIIAGVQPGVYEPEAHLFGGAESMRHVHRLFTVDAMTWLDRHAQPMDSPAWPLSLLMLRSLLDGLHVSGWEDRDVWARVAAAGRRLPPGAERTDPGVATGRLRRYWERPDELAAALPPRIQALAVRHAAAVAPLLQAWWTDYFCSEQAVLGPRQAAAYYVVFHWNRAALGFGRQVFITESLAELAGVGTDVC